MSTKLVLEGEARKRIAEFLPSAFTKAFRSYHQFMQQDVPVKTKEFSDHHKAAKVAIAHIELLIKLAKSAHVPNDDSRENHEIAVMIEQASAELAEHNYYLTEDDNNDDDDM